MNQYIRRTIVSVFVATAYSCFGPSSYGVDGSAQVAGDARCRGVVVFTVSVPASGRLDPSPLWISRNGQDFALVNPGAYLRALYTPARVRHDADDESDTRVFPLVAQFDADPVEFIFQEPGRYYLRWMGKLGDENRVFTIEQTVDVGPATQADIEFWSRLEDWDLFAALLGDRWKNLGAVEELETLRAHADVRAMMLASEIFRVVCAFRPDDSVRRGFKAGNVVAWSEALAELAKDIPDSSYAPYAAHYAAVVDVLRLAADQEHLVPHIARKARKSMAFRKADDAVEFAIQRGGRFVKPRALCIKARLHSIAAEWKEAEQALSAASLESPNDSVIAAMVSESRKGFAKNKESWRQRRGYDSPE